MPRVLGRPGKSDTFTYGPEHQRVVQVASPAPNAAVLNVNNPSAANNVTLSTNTSTTLTTYYAPGYEREVNSATGITEYKYYLSAAGRTVAIVIDRSNATTDWRYPHQDHLGSTVAITNASGQLLERYDYDAWGRRRNTDGNPSASQLIGATDRGYTDHEMLDSLGLIHMNGRVYDPLLARFVSADPFIQAADNLASYNRYSYVHNSPLSGTDPSGYFLKTLERKVRREYNRSEIFRAAVAIGAAWLTGTYWAPFGSGTTLAAFGNGALGGFSGSLVSSGGDLKAAFQGALTGGAFGYVGGFSDPIFNYAGHAVVGCASAAASGGECAKGAAAQVFSKWVTNNTPAKMDDFSRGVMATVAGGTVSVITGGKFASGAQTAAMGYLFNELMHLTTPYQRGEPHGSGLGSGTHWYDIENFACSLSQSGCSVGAVDALIKQYPAPTACVITPGCTPSTVSTGDQSFAWPVGSVTHTVSSSLVINQTLDTHLLHDGLVMRSAIERNGTVYVRSLGFGTGRFPGPNVTNAPALWGLVDRRIRTQLIEGKQ
jgi:RHS repeat-associated protein